MNIQIEKMMRILLIVIFATLFVIAPAVASEFEHSNAGITVFEMPELDIQKTYTYNTTYDYYVPVRIGHKAKMYWGEKAKINNKEYYVFNLSKLGGGEKQYLGLIAENQDITLKRIIDWFGPITFMNLTFEPESMLIDYPLWTGKMWEREEVTFSGMVWMPPSGYVPVTGTTWGYAKVLNEKDVAVPAGIIHCLVLETFMNSFMTIDGEEMWWNTSQNIWLMENGFFAKRQLYHEGIFKEELLLIEPIIARVYIKPETLNLYSNGKFIAFIELPEDFDVADIDITTIECEGAKAIEGWVADDKLIVEFNTQDLVDVSTGNKVLLTITGKLSDGTSFEGFDTIRVIDKGGKK